MAFILILAAPALAIKLSFPGESAQARGTMGYASYSAMAEGLAPGFDAPLIVAARVTPADHGAVDRLGDNRLAVARGLAAAVLVDATVVRLVLVPAVLELLAGQGQLVAARLAGPAAAGRQGQGSRHTPAPGLDVG